MERNYLASLAIEHRVAKIIQEQEEYGWLFDSQRCKKYIHFLGDRMIGIDAKLRPILPNHVKQYGVTVTEPFKMDGSPKKMVTDWIPEVDGAFTRVYFEPMNIGSDKQLKEWLLSIGWVPTMFNYRKKDTINGKKGDRTGPKLSDQGRLCPNLDKLGNNLAHPITQYLKCKHRKGLLEGLLSLVRSDGRVGGAANTLGTATFRMSHRGIVNIPGSGAFYGSNIRSLFLAKSGYSIVGVDSKACQARLLCHYMGDKEYTKQVLVMDIHEVNRRLVGLKSRSEAKTVYYAFLFGAGDPKLGASLGGTAKDGRRAKQGFLRAIPRIGSLIKRVKSRVEDNGYVHGLDGRRIYVNSPHKALNYLLQGGESVYMKYAQSILWKSIQREGLDAHYVATVHDEFQMEVLDAHVDRVRELALDAMLRAGTHLGINLPMEGEVKVGRTWRDTH